tara:strand:+ start:358 stop:723 length:366 start_codon:yes stop_codon:yes gene_type:complete
MEITEEEISVIIQPVQASIYIDSSLLNVEVLETNQSLSVSEVAQNVIVSDVGIQGASANSDFQSLVEFNRDINGRIQSIDIDSERTLIFTYLNDRIENITEGDRTIQFSYSNGILANLEVL